MKGITRSFYIRKELDTRIREIMTQSKNRSFSYVVNQLLEKALDNIGQFPIVIESRPVKGGKR
jgi:hypothetical protein